MPQPKAPPLDPNQRPEDIPLQSPMPRSPVPDNEEPELGNEPDIAPERPKSDPHA